jgi:multidrug transporter EmrE-like cation transporter
MGMVPAMLAALAFTTGGVVMKHAAGVRHAGPVAGYVILFFALRSVLQSQAMKGKELGPIYILVLGLEAALAFGVGAMLFDEAATWRKLIAVTLIVLGIALLKVD